MFNKILVANRGEIAIRAYRAATEIGARTVAVFPYEDRWSEHRMKADEAYEIGERGHPVRAYLDPEAIVEVAVKAGVDAVLADGGLDQPVHVSSPDGRHASLRRLVCDLIEEYGRHTGHADLLREAVDGLTGEDPPEGWRPAGEQSGRRP